MMSDIVETVQCTNCNLEILSSNYLIHSLYCHRNFYLCSKCQCLVNNNQEVEHNETSHVLIHCGNCKKELEKYILNEHLEKDCAFRKVKCHICDIETNAMDIIEHEDYCGCRTERCLECNEFVMLKYKALHIESNHTFLKISDEAGPSPYWQNGKRTLCNFMPDYISKQKKLASDHRRKSYEGRKKKSCRSVHDLEDEEMNLVKDSSRKRENEYVYWSKSGEFGEREMERKNLHYFKDGTNMTKNGEDWPLLPSLRSLQISERNLESVGFEVDNNSKGSANEGSHILKAVQYSKKVNWTGQKDSVFRQNENLKDSLIFVCKNKFEVKPNTVNPERSKTEMDCFLLPKKENINVQVNSTIQCSNFCENMTLASETMFEKNKYNLPVKEITNAKMLNEKIIPLTGESAIEVRRDKTGNQFVHQNNSKIIFEKNQDTVNFEVDSNTTDEKTLPEKEIPNDSFSDSKKIKCNYEKLSKFSKSDHEICEQDFKHISSKRRVLKTQSFKKEKKSSISTQKVRKE